MAIFEEIEKEQLKSEVTPFAVGDSVKVHIRVIEGEKERVQVYSGIVIARRGIGINASFIVRRVSFGEGVEKSFSLHSPRISKIQVERRGCVHRSKLYYLRKRKGKSAMAVKERSF